ncbi:MAG TPA: XRE family transcriptional regulator [Flavobacteriia bacterium]|nr:XRE family transcriptional regulator [Flavobacteriia bacterium]
MSELSDKRINMIKTVIPISVGNRIKYFRKQQEMTQIELANLAGKDRQYIYKIEKGIVTPNIVTIVILIESLNITVKDFFNKDFEY